MLPSALHEQIMIIGLPLEQLALQSLEPVLSHLVPVSGDLVLIHSALKLGNALFPLLLLLELMFQASHLRCQDTLKQSVLLLGKVFAFVALEQRPNVLFLAVVESVLEVIQDPVAHRLILKQGVAQRGSHAVSLSNPLRLGAVLIRRGS